MKHTLKFEDVEITFEADEKNAELISGIVDDLLNREGFVNLDSDDVKSIIDGAERVVAGEGTASGEDRCAQAAREAMKNVDLKDAKRVMIEVKAGPEIMLGEMADAAEVVSRFCDPDAVMMWGHVIDEDMGDAVKVGIVAAN